MPSAARKQYDHRIRQAIVATGDVDLFPMQAKWVSFIPFPDIPTSGCNGSCSVHADGWLYAEDLGTTYRIALL